MAALKLLSLHDNGLNDPRIVNSALTAVKHGYTCYFAGTKADSWLDGSMFSSMEWISWSKDARAGLPFGYQETCKQVKQVLDKIRPDIVHGHNIFAAQIAKRCGYPTVFDDHELHSVHARVKYESRNPTMKLKLTRSYIAWRWDSWERELSDSPILCVSEKIAEHHHTYHNAAHVFVTKNYPHLNEVSAIEQPNHHLVDNIPIRSVYLGGDGLYDYHPARDIQGMNETFLTNNDIGTLLRIGDLHIRVANGQYIFNHPNIQVSGYIPLKNAYDLLQTCHVGLLPWKRHWFHAYVNNNKSYEYVHAGLALFTIDDIPSVINDMPDCCVTFADLNDLKEKLRYYNEHKEDLQLLRERSLRNARTNLIWEKQESKIIEAYRTV